MRISAHIAADPAPVGLTLFTSDMVAAACFLRPRSTHRTKLNQSIMPSFHVVLAGNRDAMPLIFTPCAEWLVALRARDLALSD
jgi:hypothetical protein